MEKRLIKLTESDLRQVVNESVKSILNELDVDYDYYARQGDLSQQRNVLAQSVNELMKECQNCANSGFDAHSMGGLFWLCHSFIDNYNKFLNYFRKSLNKNQGN